jgi:hypothetical protein
VTVRLSGRDIIGILDLNADPKKLVRSDINTPGECGRTRARSGAIALKNGASGSKTPGLVSPF